MCHGGKYECDDHRPDYPGFRCCWSALSKQSCTGVAAYLDQWDRGYVESCHDQYDDGWHEDLYVYSRRWSVCERYHASDNDYFPDRTFLYCAWSAVPEQPCTGVAAYLGQWYPGDMESGHDQYCFGRYHDLYVHP